MNSRSLIFSIFDHKRQDQRNRTPEVRFSAFSATSARISENEFQEVDFQHFRPQASGSAKMNSRTLIFNIFGHRRQDQRNWAPEVRFSESAVMGAKITETGFQNFDFLHFRPQAQGSAKLVSRGSIFSIFHHRRQHQRK